MGEGTSGGHGADGGDDEGDTDSFEWTDIRRERADADSASASEDATADEGTDGASADGGAERQQRVWDQFGAEERPDSDAEEEGDAPPETPEREARSEQAEADESGDDGFERVWDEVDAEDATSGGAASTEAATAGESDTSSAVPADEPSEGDNAPAAAKPSRFDSLLGGEETAQQERSSSRGRSAGTDLASLFDDLDEFDRATSGSQVLVVSPREHRVTREVCSHYLTSGNQSSRNVLFVTTVEEPADRIRICAENEDWTGGRVGVIELGDVMAESPPEDGFESIDGNPVTYKRVRGVKNFSKLGLLITQMLKEWAGTSQPSVLCFHTLSTVSGYVQQETLFRFLFTLQAKLSSLGVTAHYHLDWGAHDAQEVATYKPIFDLTLEVDQDGRIDLD